MTNSRVADAARIVIERVGAQCGVLGAACEAKERISTLGGVVAGIASVRGWINRLRSWQEPKTDSQKCDKFWNFHNVEASQETRQRGQNKIVMQMVESGDALQLPARFVERNDALDFTL
jgi:hypothetical protein